MQSHLVALIVFSALVSTVFAVLLRDSTPARLKFGAMAFAAFVGGDAGDRVDDEPVSQLVG